jgi:glycerate dehydrogenase
MAEAFGMEVLVAQRPGGTAQPGRVGLPELLGASDVISLHVPLVDNTRHLIGAAEFALMKPGAVLINAARGGIVDEHALLEALTGGRLGGAGVDVLETEPPVGGEVLLTAELPNLIVTPHVAWAARESRQRVLDQVAENIEAFKRGERYNRVE